MSHPTASVHPTAASVHTTNPGARSQAHPSAQVASYGTGAHAHVMPGGHQASYGSQAAAARARPTAQARPGYPITQVQHSNPAVRPGGVRPTTSVLQGRPTASPSASKVVTTITGGDGTQTSVMPAPFPDAALPPQMKHPQEAVAAATKTSVPLPIVERLASIRRIKRLANLLDPEARLSDDAAAFVDELVGHFVDDALTFAAGAAKIRSGVAAQEFITSLQPENASKKTTATLDAYDIALYVKEVYPHLSLPLPPFVRNRPLAPPPPPLPAVTTATMRPTAVGAAAMRPTAASHVQMQQRVPYAYPTATGPRHTMVSMPRPAPAPVAGVKRKYETTPATATTAVPPAAKRPTTAVTGVQS